jgi:uncharacterized protein YndB with AHSA1/START domain
MVRFEQSVVINRPSEQVFEFLASPENDPQWSSASDQMRKTSRGPVGVGATFQQPAVSWGGDSSSRSRLQRTNQTDGSA